MKPLVRFILRILYRFSTRNESILNTPGPVLLIPNHVSWLDWLFIAVCLDEDWRFVTSKVAAETSWFHRKIMLGRYTFPIDMESAYAVKHMAEFLQKGGRLVLFAEGRISVTGTLMKLYEGTGFLLHRTRAKVITCYLQGANRLPLVRHSGWTTWFPRVTAHFSPLLQPPDTAGRGTSKARGHLTRWLRDQLLFQQFDADLHCGPSSVLGAIINTARQQPSKQILEDVSRQKLTYRRLLTGADLLARQWKDLLPSTPQERIGVLLPNVNAAPVVILSLWASGKVPAMLNYTTGSATMLTCAQLAELKIVISSKSFVERAKLDVQPLSAAGITLLYLEDVRPRIPRAQKLFALLKHCVAPGSGLPQPKTQAPAVIFFTSGSEGIPKGVELTHQNILANLTQMLALIDAEDHDSMFNALPLFHSFGLTVGTFLPLARGLYTFLYLSPLHYRVIPSVVYERGCTIMLGTNTFLNGYARKAHPYDFRSVRYLFGAAEKIQESTAQTWSRRFGVRILEGYGATECSPCIAVNSPIEPRFGSVGRFLPAIEWRLEPVEGLTEGGRLFVRGPNIMRGYLNPDANAQFQQLDGWYDTGDIASVDEDGFVRILGRLKRFAKVSGEMVSLTAVEEALAGAFTHLGQNCEAAIITVPDPQRGEALIAITNEPRLKLDDIRAVLRSKGFPNIAMPRALQVVREIPKLGTGKVNHRQLSQLVDFTPEPEPEEDEDAVL